jgi:hypothetical protein
MVLSNACGAGCPTSQPRLSSCAEGLVLGFDDEEHVTLLALPNAPQPLRTLPFVEQVRVASTKGRPLVEAASSGCP